MSEPSDRQPKRFKISLPIRLGAGLIGGALAATAAHFFIGDPIPTAVAAVFFGLGVAISLGDGYSSGGGGGGDGGGGG